MSCNSSAWYIYKLLYKYIYIYTYICNNFNWIYNFKMYFIQKYYLLFFKISYSLIEFIYKTMKKEIRSDAQFCEKYIIRAWYRIVCWSRVNIQQLNIDYQLLILIHTSFFFIIVNVICFLYFFLSLYLDFNFNLKIVVRATFLTM